MPGRPSISASRKISLAGIEPVEIFEPQDGRLVLAARVNEPSQHGEELALARDRIERLGQVMRVSDAQEIEDEGKRFGQGGVEQQDRAGDLTPAVGVAVLFSQAEVPAQQTKNRQKRYGLPVWNAVRFVDRNTALMRPLGELEAQPALADARLTDDPDHLPVPARGCRENRVELIAFFATANESRQTPRARHIEA